MRNPAIEFWRCFCMFAIVLGHVLVYNGLAPRSLFLWHIPGFLVISGFFGVKFSIRKLLKLLFIVWSCYWLTIPFRGGETIVSLLLPHGGWFFPFYVTMMLTAVIWNAATERRENDLKIVVVIGALILLELISLLCPRAKMLSTVTGNNEWGFLLMLCVYLLSRIAAHRHVEDKVNGWVCLSVFVCCILASFIAVSYFHRLQTYTQPISIVAGFMGFFAFSKLIRLPPALSKFICFISPSMFSVYLIHECCVKQFTHSGSPAPTMAWALTRTFLIFFFCVAIDMVRRYIFFLVKKLCQVLVEIR